MALVMSFNVSASQFSRLLSSFLARLLFVLFLCVLLKSRKFYEKELSIDGTRGLSDFF